MMYCTLPLAGLVRQFDFILIGTYFLVAIGLAIFFTRRASKSTDEFFTTGKAAPWWLAGISMVATTFAADTPLAVTGIVAASGTVGNWVWWSMALSVMATVFVYAKLWRRLGVMTDVEFAEVRYSGKPAAFLRGFRALYLGLVLNGLVLGWVTVGMRKVVEVVLVRDHEYGGMLTEKVTGLTGWVLAPLLGVSVAEWEPAQAAWGVILMLYLITALCAMLSGLWGVMVVDVFQFVIAMGMAIILAIVAMQYIDGPDGLRTQIDSRLEAEGSSLTADAYMDVLPSFAGPPVYTQEQLDALGWDAQPSWLKTQLVEPTIPPRADDAPAVVTDGSAEAEVTLPPLTTAGSSLLLTFLVFIGIQWWSIWYPGSEPGGGGYIAQRILSARDEKDSLKATLLFCICHYALRPWPWVIVGLVAFGWYGNSETVQADPEKGYAFVMMDLLGPGFLGLMLVSFLAAFMSTISTQINWGSSYLVNDVYQRFCVKKASQRHLVWVSRIATLVLMAFGVLVSTWFDSVKNMWEFVIGLGAGTGLVLMLRWFWWRINAWSEITAMLVSALVWGALLVLNKHYFPANHGFKLNFASMLLITISVSTIAWILVTLVTKPTKMDTLKEFHRRALPPGPGWKPVAAENGDVKPNQTLKFDVLNSALGSVMVFTALFGLGKVVLGEPMLGWILLAVSAISTGIIMALFKRQGFESFSK